MRISKLRALFYVGFIAVSPLVCLANAQASSDESSLVAYAEMAEAPSAELQKSEGGADAGGGNFHGTELFDDYENKGSEVISQAELRTLAEPYLSGLRKNLPAMAVALERGLQLKKWYLESKPLKQDGNCRNQSVLSVQLEIRACQSSLAVRADKTFFTAHPEVRAPLVIHELLVSLQLYKGKARVSDEAVRELSRLLRAANPDYAEIQKAAMNSGFGLYLTAAERARYLAQERIYQKAECLPSRTNNEMASRALDKRIEFFNEFSAMDVMRETEELDAQAKAELRSVKCTNPIYRR